MGTESEHIFVTVFPSEAATKVGKAILTKQFTLALAFPIIKIAEYGLSLAATEGLNATDGKEFEYGQEQVGQFLLSAGDPYSHTAEGFGAGIADVEKLPWKSILKVLTKILLGILLAEPAPEADTGEFTPA